MLYFSLLFIPAFTEAVGRAFMSNFFIVDSIYVIISAALFYSLVKSVTTNKYLSYIPFATTKAFLLLATLIIIVARFIKNRRTHN